MMQPEEVVEVSQIARPAATKRLAIPRDVLMHIGQFLTIEDLCDMCFVSRNWNRALSSNVIWKQFCSEALLSNNDLVTKAKNRKGILSYKVLYMSWIRSQARLFGASQNYSKLPWLAKQRPIANFTDYTDYNFLFKFVVLGEAGSGKSAMMLRYFDDQFSDSYISTIGVDFKVKNLFSKHGAICKLQMWDTGQTRFRQITSSYYRGGSGFIIVYDRTDLHSFQQVPQWVNEIQRYASATVKVVVVGNKSDDAAKICVSAADEAKMLTTIRNQGYPMAELLHISAKTGQGVGDAISVLLEQALDGLWNPSVDFPNIIPSHDAFVERVSRPALRQSVWRRVWDNFWTSLYSPPAPPPLTWHAGTIESY